MRFHINANNVLSALMIAGILLGGCSDERLAEAQASAEETALSPLAQLYPGQRMPDHYSRIHQAAYILVDLEQNEDAVSGTLALIVNAAKRSDCEKVTDALEPWLGLCLKSVKDGAALSFRAEAIIRRVSVGASVMGAYATVQHGGDHGPFHLVIKPTSFGDWELRPRPSEEITLGPYVEALELENGLEARSGHDNSERLIFEARTK